MIFAVHHPHRHLQRHPGGGAGGCHLCLCLGGVDALVSFDGCTSVEDEEPDLNFAHEMVLL